MPNLTIRYTATLITRVGAIGMIWASVCLLMAFGFEADSTNSIGMILVVRGDVKLNRRAADSKPAVAMDLLR